MRSRPKRDDRLSMQAADGVRSARIPDVILELVRGIVEVFTVEDNGIFLVLQLVVVRDRSRLTRLHRLDRIERVIVGGFVVGVEDSGLQERAILPGKGKHEGGKLVFISIVDDRVGDCHGRITVAVARSESNLVALDVDGSAGKIGNIAST